MPTSLKTLLLTTLTNLFLFNSCFAADTLSFSDTRIPEAPPGAQVMAGFMTISNSTDMPIDITSVISPEFSSVEMHLSKDVDGVAKMLPQKTLSIAANNTLVLQPGSYHLMLIKPKKWLSDGDIINLTFSLSNSTQQTLQVSVKKAHNKSMRTMKCGAGKCGGK